MGIKYKLKLKDLKLEFLKEYFSPLLMKVSWILTINIARRTIAKYRNVLKIPILSIQNGGWNNQKALRSI